MPCLKRDCKMLSKNAKSINRQAFKKTGKDKYEILFLLPPNIEFNDFAKPDNYISNIKKGSKLFGSVLTDMPLGVLSLSAFLKKQINLVSTCLDFNVTLNKLKVFKYADFKLIHNYSDISFVWAIYSKLYFYCDT